MHIHVALCLYVFQGFSAYARANVSLDLLLDLTTNFMRLNPHDFDIDMLIPNHSVSFLFYVALLVVLHSISCIYMITKADSDNAQGRERGEVCMFFNNLLEFL